MDIEAAKKAGEIANKIEALGPVAERLQYYLDNGWTITGLRVKSADGSQETMQPIAPLGPQASARALAFAISIYDEQVTASRSSLDKL